MRVADYIIDQIYKIGCEHIFLVTGGGAMYLNDGIAAHGKIKPICNHHEQSCAMGAVAYSKYTNGVSAVCLTTGCGGTNAITGLLDAWQDSVPVIFVSGNVNRAHMASTGVRNLGVQEANIIDIVKPITKYSVVVHNPEDIGDIMREAIHQATTGRPGPVWIDVPMDVQGASCFNIEDEILKSERPLILAGNGINCADAKNAFRAFIHKTNIPVVTSYNGVDLIQSNDSNFVGRVGIKGTRAGNFAMQNCDLLLVIGCRLPVPVTGYDYSTFAREAKVIVVDIDKDEHSKDTVKIDRFIHSDAKDFLQKNIFSRQRTKWNETCLRWREKWPICPIENSSEKVDLYYFTHVLNKLKRFDDVVISDAGSAYYVCSQSTSILDNQRYITSSAQAEMGFTIPACIGAAFAKKSDVIGVTGDGSFMMNLQELQTIVHYNLPVKLFVWNNEGYLSIRTTQKKFFEGREIGTDYESGVSIPNISKVVQSFGIEYVYADSSNLEDAITHTLNYDGPIVCEVICEKWQEVVPTLMGKKNDDGTITAKPLEDMYPFLPRDEFYGNMIVNPLD
jgi:acetolactate synthase I/II/III large subunit